MGHPNGNRDAANPLLLSRPLVGLLAVLFVALPACAGDDDSKAGGDARTTCEFAGSTEVPRVEPVEGPLRISEVRHEIVQAGCEERVVFIFESLPDNAEPGYIVRYTEPPFRGPGGEITVAGEVLLEVVLLEAFGGAAEPLLAADAELIVDIVKPPEVGGGSLWLLGLEQERPFTVSVERGSEPTLIVAIGASPDS